MDENRHLKRPYYCEDCDWQGRSGELIAKHTLVCPKCGSERVKLLVSEAPQATQ